MIYKICSVDQENLFWTELLPQICFPSHLPFIWCQLILLDRLKYLESFLNFQFHTPCSIHQLDCHTILWIWARGTISSTSLFPPINISLPGYFNDILVTVPVLQSLTYPHSLQSVLNIALRVILLSYRSNNLLHLFETCQWLSIFPKVNTKLNPWAHKVLPIWSSPPLTSFPHWPSCCSFSQDVPFAWNLLLPENHMAPCLTHFLPLSPLSEAYPDYFLKLQFLLPESLNPTGFIILELSYVYYWSCFPIRVQEVFGSVLLPAIWQMFNTVPGT